MTMSVIDWPGDHRPRERRQGNGPDAQRGIFLLPTGGKGQSAVDLAREAQGRFSSLSAPCAVARKAFCELRSLGEAAFAQLRAVK